ncbi:hypothetical protein PVK06_007564 [Gossypium arboreum]|uniref:Uncharacterized protein n=1 Tax=Gossypium arboreum TaxID=29729 RepID=A0ABR0QHN2_GOSAR|nr:hypothetical protein PVK06_007564 [Gossypium arboreum]
MKYAFILIKKSKGGTRIRVNISSIRGSRKILRKRNTVNATSNKDHYGIEKGRVVWDKGDTSGSSKNECLENKDFLIKNGI